MMRSSLLYLSRAGWARQRLTHLPGANRIASRFVAGETLDSAVEAVRALNAKGLLATLDHLGENVHTEADANRAADAYLALLDKIAASGVKSNASLKLTQLGLDVGEEVCLRNMRRILSRAASTHNFIRIDMEGSAYTEQTLRVFRTLRAEYPNVGVVIQSYLYRSEQDVAALAAEGANIRLCKGAYKEPPTVAFPVKADVDAAYLRLAKAYLDAPNTYIGLATHDDKMIAPLKAYVAERNIPRDKFEFQMLYGVRPQAQEALVKEGYKVRVYVPYGTEWYPYFMRRLAERPANVWFILKNYFRR